jgi:hypothetical protein
MTTTWELLSEIGTHAPAMTRGHVSAVSADAVEVRCDDHAGELVACDLLHTGERPPLLAVGDQVLVLRPSSPRERGVVLGRIGAPVVAAPAPEPASEAAPAPEPESERGLPDELVLEARQQLTLRVGDGSITLRADGRVQIKGKDLVSHAQRLNRIKGGAVSIN